MTRIKQLACFVKPLEFSEHKKGGIMAQLYKVKTEEKDADVDKDGFLRSFGVTHQYTRGEAIKKARMFNGKIEKGMISEQGLCPKCQTHGLEYGAMELQDSMIYYAYSCENCTFEGKEWFELSFQCHTDKNGEEL